MTTLTLCSPAMPSARRQTRRLATSPQRLLPFPAQTARVAAPQKRAADAIGAPPSSSGNVISLVTTPRLAIPAAAQTTEIAGAKFARQRLAYAVETTVGSIMLIGFLVLALFG